MDMNGMKMAAALQGRGNAGRVMQGMPMAQPGIQNRQGMPQQPLQAGPQGMNTQTQMQDLARQAMPTQGGMSPEQAMQQMGQQAQMMRPQGMSQQDQLQQLANGPANQSADFSAQRAAQAQQGYQSQLDAIRRFQANPQQQMNTQGQDQMASQMQGRSMQPSGQQPFAGKPGMGSGSMPMPRR